MPYLIEYLKVFFAKTNLNSESLDELFGRRRI
jgi:hypothetical protein